MIRDSLSDFKGLDHDPDFHWRGTNVTRIENLSDIVFAIALGMLISGVDAPRNIAELRDFLLYIFPTAAGFMVLLGLWHAHYTFFRRYGVADQTIIRLNAILIFVILFMTYPLRFAFDSLFGVIISSMTGDFSRNIELGVTSFANSGELVGSFAFAYGAAFTIFALMVGHVLKRAEVLNLSPFELAETRQLRFLQWGRAIISFLVAGLAFLSPLYL